MRMMLNWVNVVVGPSALWPAVFTVVPSFRQPVRDWVTAQDVAFAGRHEVGWPLVEAWAVLDGGVTTVSGYGLTSLPHGMRVLGYGALRLLLADLGADTPAEPFPGERLVDIEELRRRHRAARKDAPETIEQAEMLASCRDADLLRWVATTLYEEAHRATAPVAEPHPRAARHNTAGSPSRRRKAARSSPAVG